jgi:DNA recombination protein RmuC
MTLYVLLAAIMGAMAGAALAVFFKASRLRALMAVNDQLQEKLQQQAVIAARQQERLLVAAEQEKAAATLHEKMNEERRVLEKSLRESDTRFAEIDTRLHAEREQVATQARFVKEQEQLLTLQIEKMTTKIFSENSQKFSEQSKEGLDGLLNPLREQLKEFREKVENSYSKETLERSSLKEQILRLEGLNKKISDDANNLTNALKGDKKLQGNWGEVILSRVLEESGLREGHEYFTQFSVVADDGQRRLPDVIVRLPENRDIVIDSKVSLNDYERYCRVDSEGDREAALKAHIGAVRKHIKDLSEKRYEDLPGLRTLDFVFLFMPIEAAFMVAVEHDPALFSEAFNKKIIIVSPTTLLATLRTVESIWRYEKQNKNAEKIAKEAGLLHDKFSSLLDHLKRLGASIERSREIFTQASASLDGHGGLIGKVDGLRKLGAKTKKTLPVDRLGSSAEFEGDLENEAGVGLDAEPMASDVTDDEENNA